MYINNKLLQYLTVNIYKQFHKSVAKSNDSSLIYV